MWEVKIEQKSKGPLISHPGVRTDNGMIQQQRECWRKGVCWEEESRLDYVELKASMRRDIHGVSQVGHGVDEFKSRMQVRVTDVDVGVSGMSSSYRVAAENQ